MSCLKEFATDFSSFKIDLELDEYWFNIFDLPLLTRQDEVPGPKVKNEDKEDIENMLNFNQILGLCSFTSKRRL